MEPQQKTFLIIAVIVVGLFAAFKWHQDGNNPDDSNPNGAIKAGALIALILTETDREDDYPIEQQASLRSSKVQDYLDDHCVKIGERPAWRLLDNDSQACSDDKPFRELLCDDIEEDQLSKETLDLRKKIQTLTDDDMPYVIFSDGKKNGVGMPWGKDVDSNLATLKKWGG